MKDNKKVILDYFKETHAMILTEGQYGEIVGKKVLANYILRFFFFFCKYVYPHSEFVKFITIRSYKVSLYLILQAIKFFYSDGYFYNFYTN